MGFHAARGEAPQTRTAAQICGLLALRHASISPRLLFSATGRGSRAGHRQDVRPVGVGTTLGRLGGTRDRRPTLRTSSVAAAPEGGQLAERKEPRGREPPAGDGRRRSASRRSGGPVRTRQPSRRPRAPICCPTGWRAQRRSADQRCLPAEASREPKAARRGPEPRPSSTLRCGGCADRWHVQSAPGRTRSGARNQ